MLHRDFPPSAPDHGTGWDAWDAWDRQHSVKSKLRSHEVLNYPLVMTNIAMENPNHKWRFIAGKIIYKWAIYTMAMLVITRGYVCQVLRRTDALTLEKCCDRPSAARRFRSHEELQTGWGDPVPYFALKPQVPSTQSAETVRVSDVCVV